MLKEHWPPLLVGAIFSATPVGYGTATLLGGRLADRLPPKRLCWAALGCLVVGFGIALPLPGGATFLLFYAFLALGLGGGLALAGGLGSATQAFPGRPGAVGGALTGAYASASVIQAPLVTFLAYRIGWLGALRAVAIAFALVAVVAVLAMPSLGAPVRTAGSQERARIGTLLRRPLIWTGILAEVCLAPLGSFAFVNLAAFAHRHGVEVILAGSILIAMAVANTAGRVGMGAASDRFGVNRVLAVILAADLVAATLILAAPVGWVLVVAGLGAGAALGGGAGILSRMASEAAPDVPHSAFGLLFTGYAAGAFAGPLLGALAGGGGDRGFAAVGLPALAGLVVVAARRRSGAARLST